MGLNLIPHKMGHPEDLEAETDMVKINILTIKLKFKQGFQREHFHLRGNRHPGYVSKDI